MPDPQLAHARRGAEWTFDARAYVACLSAIKATGEDGQSWRAASRGWARPAACFSLDCRQACALALAPASSLADTSRPPAVLPHPPPSTAATAGEASAPSFEHATGDPRAGDIAVGRHHRVVLSEGNYVLLVR